MNYDKAMVFKLIQSSVHELNSDSGIYGQFSMKAVLGHTIARAALTLFGNG
jgi:hypothetical protein